MPRSPQTLNVLFGRSQDLAMPTQPPRSACLDSLMLLGGSYGGLRDIISISGCRVKDLGLRA